MPTQMLAICDSSLIAFAASVVERVDSVSSFQIVAVTSDPRDIDMRMPDVVLLFVGLATVDNRSAKRFRDLAELYRIYQDVRIFSVFVGSGKLPDALANAAYVRLSCPDDSPDQRSRLAETISTLLGKTAGDLDKGRSSFTEERAKGASLQHEIITKGVATLISILPLLILLLLHEELSLRLTGALGDGVAQAVIVLLFLVTSGFAFACFIRFLFAYLRFVLLLFDIRRRNEEREDAIRYARRLRSVVEYDEGRPMSASMTRVNALERMLVNLEDIKAYYTWSQEQARAAFRLACALCIAGFVLLVAAVVLPLLVGMGWQASVVPAVGGAVSELLAATALLVYRYSLAQLNHYHNALHEDERFLSAVSLVDRFESQEMRDRILAQIVKSELAMNLAATGLSASSSEMGDGGWSQEEGAPKAQVPSA